jgi:hypothetical protein
MTSRTMVKTLSVDGDLYFRTVDLVIWLERVKQNMNYSSDRSMVQDIITEMDTVCNHENNRMGNELIPIGRRWA